MTKFKERTSFAAQSKFSSPREATVQEGAGGIAEFEAIAASHGIALDDVGERVEEGATAAESQEEFYERMAATLGPDAGT